jgi:hypothetical protein
LLDQKEQPILAHIRSARKDPFAKEHLDVIRQGCSGDRHQSIIQFHRRGSEDPSELDLFLFCEIQVDCDMHVWLPLLLHDMNRSPH